MSVDGDRAASDRSDAEREKDKDTERSRDNDKEREKSDQPAEEYKIFVGGISWHMDDRELKDTFRKYGAVDARVMLDRVTQRSRGFGFVHFDNKEDLEEAVEKMHDTEIDGRKISVNRAIPQERIQPGTPAHALSRSRDRYRDERGYRGSNYDRGYGASRGYDRGGYDYDRYDRRGGGYGDRYDAYGGSGGYDRGYGYDDGYGRGYERYESDRRDRYGPERAYDRYSSRSGPYDR